MLVLEAGADIYIKGDDEKTAMEWAKEKKHAKIVDFLREYQLTVLIRAL